MILTLYRGASLLSVLLALTLFSSIFIAMQSWAHFQRQSAVQIYQRFQAIQIAENQKQRQFLGLGCLSQVQQNQMTFHIHCQNDRISVSYPMGKIEW